MHHQEIDRALHALASVQHGCLSRAQVLARGGTDRMIAARLARGTWRQVAPGVYWIAGSAATWRRRAMAATLAHPLAVLDGASACTVCRLPGFGRPDVHPMRLAVPWHVRHTNPLATVTRRKLIVPTRREWIPTVAPVQAFLDVVPTMHQKRACHLLEDCLREGHFTPEQLSAHFALLAQSRRPGIGLLRELVSLYGPEGEGRPRTEMERLLHSMMGLPGMPEWVAEASPPWWTRDDERVDVLIPAHETIIEADGRAWHERLRNMANDRRRDNLAAAHGHRVLRFVWEQLVHELEESAEIVLVTCGLQTFRVA